MRLFIAVTFCENIKKIPCPNSRRIYTAFGVGATLPRSRIFISQMAFIGEYSDPDAVLDAMEASRPESAVLALEGVGSFGKLWWIGLKKDESLFANSRRLRRALSDAGIPFDRKRFSPHITLVRKPVCRDESVLASITVPSAQMKVDYISLMRSDRGKSGMIYSEIGRVYCTERKRSPQ